MKNNVLVRYLLKELLLYFLIAFLFFFFVFFINQILLMAERILEKRVPVYQVLKLMFYSLPFIIAQAAPFATLVGFLMCLGRIVTDNEILILRATGSSFFLLVKPVLFLGLIISFASFFVNDVLLPLGTIAYNNLSKEIIMSDPSVELETNSIKRMDKSVLVIGDVTDKNISDLVFFDTDSEGNQRILLAEDTKVVDSHDRSILMQLAMQNPILVTINQKNNKNFDYLSAENSLMNIFSSSIFYNHNTSVNPREMTSYDLSLLVKDMKKDESVSSFQLNIYLIELYKKFSLPFGSLFFAMLALPLALMFGKVNGQTLGLIIGIFLSVFYWACIILGQTLGFRNGFNGFWLMWGPNFLMGFLGIIFFLRLVKK